MQAGKSRRFTIMSAASMLMMLSCLGHGWAQTLNGPYGLALDSRGNLYVADVPSDQVLVYNPNYVQQATITSGLSAPTGVAFDSKGNVYVANLSRGGNGYITQYSSAGVLNTSFSITDGINQPLAITIDALDDLWVVNQSNITVYPLADTISGPFLLRTISFPYGCDIDANPCAIAVHSGNLYVGEQQQGTLPFWEKGFVSELLAGSGGFPVFQSTNGGVTALATDSAGHLYVVTGNGEVDFWGPKGKVVFLKAQGNLFPDGIAVDSARGRVYLSSPIQNKVAVYSTNRTLLHTIQ